MGPPTLVSMAQRACIRNVAGLQDVGDIPYDLVRPILRKVDNPDQLREIEKASPHIADLDAELWKAFIVRDILEWEQKLVEPKNPRNWPAVYRKLKEKERKAKEEQEEQLKAALMGLDKKKEARQAQIVQEVIPQRSRGTRFVDGVLDPRNRQKTPTLQNAKRGQILSAIRKQSSSANRQRGFINPQPAMARTPDAKSQIKRAPEGMVRDHTKPIPTAIGRHQMDTTGDRNAPVPRVFVSRHVPTAQERAIRDALRAEQAKKEEKLWALTSNGPKMSTPAASPCPSASEVRAPPTANHSSPKAASPVPIQEPRSLLATTAGPRRTFSPSPAPLVRKRPAPASSIFMPKKKKV